MALLHVVKKQLEKIQILSLLSKTKETTMFVNVLFWEKKAYTHMRVREAQKNIHLGCCWEDMMRKYKKCALNNIKNALCFPLIYHC